MGKALTEMTLEELWKLFPIRLSEHKDEWKDWYTEEEARIAAFLPIAGARISHIGSTAIAGIWAKPIVDILLELPEAASMEAAKQSLTDNGYRCMAEAADRCDFNRGYTSEGFAEKVFHLHLRYFGDNDELYFRDYLNAHPAVAKEYEALKRALWKQHEHNRDAYTAAKSAFVMEQTRRAKELYRNRYA